MTQGVLTDHRRPIDPRIASMAERAFAARARRNLPLAGRGLCVLEDGRSPAARRSCSARTAATGGRRCACSPAAITKPPSSWPARCSPRRPIRSGSCSARMRRLFVLRPEPGASADRRRAPGHGSGRRRDAIVRHRAARLGRARPERFDALLLTSANAVRHGGEALRELPGSAGSCGRRGDRRRRARRRLCVATRRRWRGRSVCSARRAGAAAASPVRRGPARARRLPAGDHAGGRLSREARSTQPDARRRRRRGRSSIRRAPAPLAELVARIGRPSASRRSARRRPRRPATAGRASHCAEPNDDGASGPCGAAVREPDPAMTATNRARAGLGRPAADRPVPAACRRRGARPGALAHYAGRGALPRRRADAAAVRQAAPARSLPHPRAQALPHHRRRRSAQQDRADRKPRSPRVENATQRVEGSAGRADALLVAFAARRAIDRGVALGYLEPLLVDRFGRTHPARSRRSSPARTPVRLEQSVDRVSSSSARAALGRPAGKLVDQFKRELGSLIQSAAPTGRRPSLTRAIDRAAAAPRRGEVDDALAETMRLPGAANAPARGSARRGTMSPSTARWTRSNSRRFLLAHATPPPEARN